MKAAADKNQDNQSKSVAHEVASVSISPLTEITFEDKRPETLLQQKRQEMIDNSPQVKQLQSYQRMTEGKTGTPNGVVQRTLTSSPTPPTVAPVTNAALRAWILANCSARVQEFVTSDKFDFRITWNDALPAAADTNLLLEYTDAAGTQGTFSLFAATASTTLDGLVYPLEEYTIHVRVEVQAADAAYPNSPVNIAAVTKWQTNLAHELEIHTRLATQINESMMHMESRPTDIDSQKRKNATSIAVRSDAAEHTTLATGGGGVSDTFEKVVLSAPAAQQASILIDAAWDRRNHMGFVQEDEVKKTAYRDIIKWVKMVQAKLQNVTAGDTARIEALLALLKSDLDDLYA